jgi:type I restriction enzyme M protein
MLDTATKRRIDTARDILVGKVPDPKSQVEQITIALIYKFMDDMDAEAEELGGKRSFFAGDFAKYGWAKLMRSGLGGHEMLGLYAEAITRMPENPGVPALFRDIFKNAYLPYRDPETLRAFLKVIDEFEYDHSERLGDAFEYLLSVLGSQGDAGQFRTPRHIIDFIVDIVDPKTGETILDPACGTAGFLISAWKHIQAANRDEHGESTLSPDEQERLAENIKGYDISPDMVRLSLTNMYLHGFTDPHIVEYDTLTSDERWNEYADVILANPPFMSPKGGIRPHNRFSIQSNRSEVLFVDYMAEHLTPNGRAGIIVPEGVIFQSGKAYKALRKELVEKYLVAVVSLPAGVFNPYSGVKTSILILDRAAAKASDTVGFFKVTNDGFGLGAQRREVGGGELPEILTEITEYRAHRGELAWEGRFGQGVAKAYIAASGDYNLSAERYRLAAGRPSSFASVSLGAISIGKPQYGSGASKVPFDGRVRYIRITDLTDAGKLKPDDPVSPSIIEEDYFLSRGDLLIARSGSVGRTYLHGQRDGQYQFAGYLIRFRVNRELALPEFVFWITQSDHWKEWLTSQSKTGTITNINAQQYASFEFPLPPLEMQREIVAEIEGYQKVIDGARAVVENYRPHVAINSTWPLIKLGEIARLINGRAYKQEELLKEGPVPVLRVGNFFSNRSWYYSDLQLEADKYCEAGDLLYAWSASFGPKIWDGPKAIFHYHMENRGQPADRQAISVLSSVSRNREH